MKATHTPPTAAEPTPAELLRCAAIYLQRHGWTQGTYYADDPSPDLSSDATPPACAMGALAMAAFGQRLPDSAWERPEWADYKRAEDALLTHLNLLYPPTSDDDFPNPGIGDWNDQPDRTAAQVVHTLTTAADEWEHHHTPRAVPA